MKILFACPTLDIRYEWLQGFIQVQEQLKKYSIEYYIPYRRPLIIADTNAAQKAIDEGFDYILRMDDDVWDIPPNAVEELLKADKDFISCVMYANDFPYHRCCGTRKNKDDDLREISKSQTGGIIEAGGTGVVPVDFTATPFTLIKTRIFKLIPKPWWEHTEEVPADSYFCQKMLEYHIQPYVHMDLQVNHRGVTHWNRGYRFMADAEHFISVGQLTEKHKLFKTYLERRNYFVETYGKKDFIYA